MTRLSFYGLLLIGVSITAFLTNEQNTFLPIALICIGGGLEHYLKKLEKFNWK